MLSRLGLALLALAVGGCAITQEVTPVKLGQPTQDLCVVRNSEVVQDGFHGVYVQVLERKGFRVRTLPDKSPIAMSLQITPGGAISGNSLTGCNVSGTADLQGANAVYTLRLTYGSGCKLNGVTHTGHAVLTRGTLLRAVATAQDLSDAVIFIGSKI